MTRYYCDYCDTYLTHDSVRAGTERLLFWCDLMVPRRYLAPLLTALPCVAACRAEAAQLGLQAQGEQTMLAGA